MLSERLLLCHGATNGYDPIVAPLPDRDTFLSETRLGILTTMTSGGAPIAVPVWYEWDGERARIFSYNKSAKVRRLQHDPRASLLVTNVLGEQEYWVAIDGTMMVQPEGAIDLAERLAARYWDLNSPERAAAVRGWRETAETLVLLELTPMRIRSYSG
jgi:PPOX class probable F420-dependent enzyme